MQRASVPSDAASAEQSPSHGALPSEQASGAQPLDPARADLDDEIAVYEAAARRMRPSWDPPAYRSNPPEASTGIASDRPPSTPPAQPSRRVASRTALFVQAPARELAAAAAPEVAPAPSQTAAPEVAPAPSQTAAPEVAPAPSQTAALELAPVPSQTAAPLVGAFVPDAFVPEAGPAPLAGAAEADPLVASTADQNAPAAPSQPPASAFAEPSPSHPPAYGYVEPSPHAPPSASPVSAGTQLQFPPPAPPVDPYATVPVALLHSKPSPDVRGAFAPSRLESAPPAAPPVHFSPAPQFGNYDDDDQPAAPKRPVALWIAAAVALVAGAGFAAFRHGPEVPAASAPATYSRTEGGDAVANLHPPTSAAAAAPAVAAPVAPVPAAAVVPSSEPPAQAAPPEPSLVAQPAPIAPRIERRPPAQNEPKARAAHVKPAREPSHAVAKAPKASKPAKPAKAAAPVKAAKSAPAPAVRKPNIGVRLIDDNPY